MLPIIISNLEDPKEREFMARLYEENEGLFFATALKYVSTHYDAEEIVQDSLVKLIKKVSTLQRLERCTLVAYVVYTVRNTAINRLRKQSKERDRRVNFDELDQEYSLPLTLDELLILAENHRELVALWRELPEVDRLLLDGKYFLELSDAELARQVGCKANSVRMKLTRARRTAMKAIADKEVELI